MIHVCGTLCPTTASALHDAVQSALAGRPPRLVLDLHGVSSGTETGWWALHAVADQAQQHGAVTTAAVPNPRLRARLVGVASCGLRLVDALPVTGQPSAPAELPRVALPAAGRLSGWGIEELLRRYGTALAHGDAATASRCHTEPTFVTESRTVHTIPTLEEVGRSLSQLALGYRDAGLVSARPALQTVRLLNTQYCEATVLWCHGGDRRSCVHARYRYLLRRVPHDRTTGSASGPVRINTVTLLDGPRIVTPLGT